MKLCCEKYLIDALTLESYYQISEQAELYNAERLKEYCCWFQRRHSQYIPPWTGSASSQSLAAEMQAHKSEASVVSMSHLSIQQRPPNASPHERPHEE